MSKLNLDRLKEALVYDEWSGLFFFRKKRGQFPAGYRAGSPDKDGYILICIDQVAYRAHRLVWFWFHGSMPEGEIDHIDCDRANNRIDNLRIATHAQNKQNSRAARVDNTSGLLGVKFDKRRGSWSSRITKDYKAYYLGTFPNKEDSQAAYLAAKLRLHDWHFSTKETIN